MHVFLRQREEEKFSAETRLKVGVEGLIMPRLFRGLCRPVTLTDLRTTGASTRAHASAADGKASWGRLAATLLRSLSLPPEHTAHRHVRARAHARRQAGVKDQTRGMTCGSLQAGAAPPRLHF